MRHNSQDQDPALRQQFSVGRALKRLAKPAVASLAVLVPAAEAQAETPYVPIKTLEAKATKIVRTGKDIPFLKGTLFFQKGHNVTGGTPSSVFDTDATGGISYQKGPEDFALAEPITMSRLKGSRPEGDPEDANMDNYVFGTLNPRTGKVKFRLIRHTDNFHFVPNVNPDPNANEPIKQFAHFPVVPGGSASGYTEPDVNFHGGTRLGGPLMDTQGNILPFAQLINPGA